MLIHENIKIIGSIYATVSNQESLVLFLKVIATKYNKSTKPKKRRDKSHICATFYGKQRE